MWFDGQRQPNTLYVANTSRGKDSTAMLRAIQLMGWPLDMICSVDIWFDESTPAELPPMVKFKDEYDRKVFEWFGVPVTRLCATKRSQICKVERERESRNQTETVTHKGCRSPHCSTAGCIQKNTDGTSKDSQTQTTHGASCSRTSSTADTVSKLTYKDIFYRKVLPKTGGGARYFGFPNVGAPACSGTLKRDTLTDSRLRQAAEEIGVHASNRSRQRISLEKGRVVPGPAQREFLDQPVNDGQKINIVHYIGIAADEPKRIAKHIDKPDKVLPLVQIGWDEPLCGLEAQYMDMLSPTYSDGQLRDGCWFCHNQGVNQLRRLRKNYPDLWKKLMKLDLDSPVSFKPDGHTVHDYDRRFQFEDEGLIDPSLPFRWKMLDDDLQYHMEL